MPYVWLEDLGEFKHYDKSLVIDDEKYEKFYAQYEEKIANEEGSAYFENGELVYEENKVLILINKKMGYFSLIDSPIDDEIYETKSIPYSEYLKYQEEKNNGKIVTYKNNKFNVITLKQDEEYDFENDKVVINYESRKNRILGNFSVDEVISDIKNRGFKYIFNGKEYYQPFRDINDKYTFIASKSLPSKDRIIKLYYKRIKGAKSLYDTLKGEIITDEFLDKMIKDYQIYESFLKGEVEIYLSKIKDIKEEEDFIKIKSNYIDEILEVVMKKYGK